MNAVGTNTAESTSAIPTTGAVNSSMAFNAASLGARPSSICRPTPSTTTIASSTTNPIASTSPNSESVLIENPNNGKNTNVPTSATGTASMGISVARQLCRKMYTTRITSAMAISSVSTISLIPEVTDLVVSSEVT